MLRGRAVGLRRLLLLVSLSGLVVCVGLSLWTNYREKTRLVSLFQKNLELTALSDVSKCLGQAGISHLMTERQDAILVQNQDLTRARTRILTANLIIRAPRRLNYRYVHPKGERWTAQVDSAKKSLTAALMGLRGVKAVDLDWTIPKPQATYFEDDVPRGTATIGLTVGSRTDFTRERGEAIVSLFSQSIYTLRADSIRVTGVVEGERTVIDLAPARSFEKLVSEQEDRFRSKLGSLVYRVFGAKVKISVALDTRREPKSVLISGRKGQRLSDLKIVHADIEIRGQVENRDKLRSLVLGFCQHNSRGESRIRIIEDNWFQQLPVVFAEEKVAPSGFHKWQGRTFKNLNLEGFSLFGGLASGVVSSGHVREESLILALLIVLLTMFSLLVKKVFRG